MIQGNIKQDVVAYCSDTLNKLFMIKGNTKFHYLRITHEIYNRITHEIMNIYF